MSKANRQLVVRAAEKMLARGLSLNLGQMAEGEFKPLTEGHCQELKAADLGYRNLRTLWAALDKVEPPEAPVLEQEHPEESGSDYRMKDGEQGCWIRMTPFLVHLYFTDEGMVCDIHSDTPAFGEAIATTYAFAQEAEDAACDEFSGGEGIDLDDVAEWVGLHYRKNFDTESPSARLDWIRRYAEAHAEGMTETPTEKTADQTSALRAYRVMLHEEPGDKHQLVFDCWARDAEQASDQAEATYPGCEVRVAFPCDDTELYVIYSASEAADEPESGFWSNQAGWGRGEQATLFTAQEQATFDLPLSAGQDAQWLSLPEAERLLTTQQH